MFARVCACVRERRECVWERHYTPVCVCVCMCVCAIACPAPVKHTEETTASTP